MTPQLQVALQQFKAQLTSIHATERRIAAEEAAIERQLAIAWFLTHPEEAKPITLADPKDA